MISILKGSSFWYEGFTGCFDCRQPTVVRIVLHQVATGIVHAVATAEIQRKYAIDPCAEITRKRSNRGSPHPRPFQIGCMLIKILIGGNIDLTDVRSGLANFCSLFPDEGAEALLHDCCS
ncbi:Uncharacterised protein [Actinobacillus pleuropneumoniae]|nr:Uncharacterised protein [Actinobacillus pleuropneumoniae]